MMAATRAVLEVTTAKTTTTNTTTTSKQMHSSKTTTSTAVLMGTEEEYPADTIPAMATQAMRALMEVETFLRWGTVLGRAAMVIAVAHYPGEERRAPALKVPNQCQPISDGPGLNDVPGKIWLRSQSPSFAMTPVLAFG